MNLPYNILKIIILLTLSVMVVACQDTIPSRETIMPGSGTAPATCTENDAEVTPTLPKCEVEPVTRPDNAVFWKSDFCACKDSVPVTYGNCASFCSGRNTNGVETLFANFTVTEAISLSGLGNLQAWCSAPLPGDQQNPSCQLEARDAQGQVVPLEVSIAPNSNSLTANIHDRLDFDKTYILTLVEVSSGAKSNAVQAVKFSPDVSVPVLGPLKNVPVSQYTCMVREFSTDGSGNIFYDQAYRLHFYYIPSSPPTPVPAGNSHLICHDIFNPLYGQVDDPLYPRFENVQGIFNLWDMTDPRFYDNNGNGAMDVNDLIIQKTRHFGGNIPDGTNFFSTFRWPGSPNLSTDAGNNDPTFELGYYMAPWINQSTFKSYCLNSTHYNSSNPLFNAMRDIIGVDTEGLYIGEKSAETVVRPDGTVTSGHKDYILIRETDLKQVWFYLNNGTPTAPTDNNVSSHAIFFYYPLNKASPFVRTSTQRIYRVRGANELSGVSGGGSTGTGAPTSYPPHDRKIGCVPKF